MEASHTDILRKNLVYLKENLDMGDVLDHLYQEGIFTHSEYNRCKQAGLDRCGTLLEILMKKGEDAYKSLCAVLDRSQPQIKQQLDSTSSQEGATSLLYVNKPKLEQQFREQISAKENTIKELQHQVSSLWEELDTIKQELESAKTAREEDRQKHLTELEEEKQKYKSGTEREILEKERAQGQVKKYEQKVRDHLEIIDSLKKDLAEQREKYEAITHITKPEITNVSKQEQHAKTQEAQCVFDSQSTCDESQLMLLPCLHAACQPCIDNHKQQGRLLCLCGEETDLKIEELPADYVRQNEAAYRISKDSQKKCTYIEHEDEMNVTLYCHNCGEFFCSNCKDDVHDKIKKHKNHKVTEIQQAGSITLKEWLQEKTCPDHPKHPLELYDDSCKKPVCIICARGHHMHHDNYDLQFVYKQKESTLQDLLQKVQSKLEDITTLVQAVERHQAEHAKTTDILESEDCRKVPPTSKAAAAGHQTESCRTTPGSS